MKRLILCVLAYCVVSCGDVRTDLDGNGDSGVQTIQQAGKVPPPPGPITPPGGGIDPIEQACRVRWLACLDLCYYSYVDCCPLFVGVCYQWCNNEFSACRGW